MRNKFFNKLNNISSLILSTIKKLFAFISLFYIIIKKLTNYTLIDIYLLISNNNNKNKKNHQIQFSK